MIFAVFIKVSVCYFECIVTGTFSFDILSFDLKLKLLLISLRQITRKCLLDHQVTCFIKAVCKCTYSGIYTIRSECCCHNRLIFLGFVAILFINICLISFINMQDHIIDVFISILIYDLLPQLTHDFSFIRVFKRLTFKIKIPTYKFRCVITAPGYYFVDKSLGAVSKECVSRFLIIYYSAGLAQIILDIVDQISCFVIQSGAIVYKFLDKINLCKTIMESRIFCYIIVVVIVTINFINGNFCICAVFRRVNIRIYAETCTVPHHDIICSKVFTFVLCIIIQVRSNIYIIS